jgi:sulfonate transport system permease protein
MSSEPSGLALVPSLLRRRAQVSTPTAITAPVRSPRALRRVGVVAAQAVLPVLLLVLWDQSARRGWVSDLILPAPALVWESFRTLWEDGTILTNLAVSSGRVARGFAIGAGIGLGLGTLLGLSSTARAYLRPTLLGVYQVNVLAWIPLFIFLVGIDEGLKVTVVAFSTVLPVTVNTIQGVSGVPARWLELARVYQLKPSELVWRVAVPAALPSLFTGLRTGLAAAWMSLVMVELIASSEGVGFMVVWGRQLFQLDIVMVAIVLIGLVGLALDLGLHVLERRLRAWHFDAVQEAA